MRNELTASLVIALGAVILGRIMRSGDNNAAEAAEISYGEGKLGGSTERLEKINLNAVGGENSCRNLGKKTSAVTVVVGDNNAILLGFFSL